ncbi:hypothetical protein ACLOJK_028046 [Asimina triloba]
MKLHFLIHPSSLVACKSSSSFLQRLAFFSTSFNYYYNPSSKRKQKKQEEKEWENLDRAFNLLQLIRPEYPIQRSKNHLRLVLDCIRELSQSNPSEERPERSRKAAPDDREDAVHAFDTMLEDRKKTGNANANVVNISGILSDYGAVGDVGRGMQMHSLVIKSGLDGYVSIGSALVSLYCKCGILEDAYRVFDHMPVRNTVSWTALITGLAQTLNIQACLELFIQMKRLSLQPNDFTFASLLSAYAVAGSLRHGRTAHCMVIQMGFDSYVHVENALVSMYAKCGSMDEAFFVFQRIPKKDLISWNSVITGYAQHGLAVQALDLFHEMESKTIEPDAITYLAVLSSCRHAGLVEQGRSCFESMLGHGVRPELDHYSCIVDLLGRAGLLEEAYEFIKKMPLAPNPIIWGSLLSSCTLHGNVLIGTLAAENRLLCEPDCAATHVQLANLYASVGWWNHVVDVRKKMKQRGIKPSTGYSWIEIGGEIYWFKAEDGSSSYVDKLFSVLVGLQGHMRGTGEHDDD